MKNDKSSPQATKPAMIRSTLAYAIRRFYHHKILCFVFAVFFLLLGCLVLVHPVMDTQNPHGAQPLGYSLSEYGKSTSDLLMKIRKLIEDGGKIGKGINSVINSENMNYFKRVDSGLNNGNGFVSIGDGFNDQNIVENNGYNSDKDGERKDTNGINYKATEHKGRSSVTKEGRNKERLRNRNTDSTRNNKIAKKYRENYKNIKRQKFKIGYTNSPNGDNYEDTVNRDTTKKNKNTKTFGVEQNNNDYQENYEPGDEIFYEKVNEMELLNGNGKYQAEDMKEYSELNESGDNFNSKKGNKNKKKQRDRRINVSGLYTEDVLFKLSENWTSEDTAKEASLMKQRSQRVREECQKLKNQEDYAEFDQEKLFRKKMRWIMEHDFAWCPIFKAASTTWAKNLLILAGDPIKKGRFHAKTLEYFGRPEDETFAKKFLDNTMKILIVRHPLDRILSAYRDKMLRVTKGRETEAYREIQKEIHTSYPDPPLPAQYDSIKVRPTAPQQPTFNQFLLRVRHDLQTYWERKGKFYINFHWRPYWATCSPCLMDYSVIAKVETMKTDQEFIIRDRKLEAFPLMEKSHSSKFDSFNTTEEATQAYFSSVPQSLYQEVVALYGPDFDLFDYDPNKYLQLAIPGI